MKCSYCGTRINKHEYSCNKCGAPADLDDEPQKSTYQNNYHPLATDKDTFDVDFEKIGKFVRKNYKHIQSVSKLVNDFIQNY